MWVPSYLKNQNYIMMNINMAKTEYLIKCAGWLSLVLLSCSCEKRDTRPNILFILADDLRADALGCYGNNIIKTPNIDRLAETGMLFTNSYIMGGHHGAISAPSRAMLLSGKYLFNVYGKSRFDLQGTNT